MTVATMRAIDRYAGIPLCWLVGIAVRIRDTVAAGRPPRDPERILFIKFFGLGSLILTMPAVTAMRERFPGARIAYLTFASHRGLLERYACIDELLIIDPSTPRAFLRSTARVLARFRKAGYDTVIDFEFFSKFSTLLSSLTGATRRSGFRLPAAWRRLHLTHATALSKAEHVTAGFGRQVSAFAGRTPDNALIPPAVTAADESSLLAKVPINGSPPAVFHVTAGATFAERRWPAERFAGLIREVTGGGAEVYLTGTSEERPYVDAVIEQSGCRPRCINLAGLLTLPELAALLRQAGLVVSNDSGPVHLAAALGVRVIGLYGPESPVFYGPLGPQAAAVYQPTPCSPCMNVYAAKDYRCPYKARCMDQITVDHVLRHLDTVPVG